MVGPVCSSLSLLAPVPAPTPASLGTGIGGHSDHQAAGSQHPAASSPGHPSARPALPSPPGWLRALEPMESVCPSLLCLLVLPSLHSMLSFFWFIRP